MRDLLLFQLPEQLSLFEPPRVRPRWKDLPPNVRREADRLLTKMLRVVQPGVIEAALHAGGTITDKQDEVIKALLLELEAAHYAVERAWKQFDAVDPANRLVADELERRWNSALQRTCELEQRIELEQSRRKTSLRPCSLLR